MKPQPPAPEYYPGTSIQKGKRYLKREIAEFLVMSPETLSKYLRLIEGKLQEGEVQYSRNQWYLYPIHIKKLLTHLGYL